MGHPALLKFARVLARPVSASAFTLTNPVRATSAGETEPNLRSRWLLINFRSCLLQVVSQKSWPGSASFLEEAELDRFIV